jgi:hypothetical protein
MDSKIVKFTEYIDVSINENDWFNIIVDDKEVFDGCVYVDQWIPLYYSKDYEKFSVKAPNALVDIANKAEKVCSAAFQNKIDKEGYKVAKLTNDQYVKIKPSKTCLFFDQNKKPISVDDVKKGKFDCRFVFKFGKLNMFRKYLCCSMYVSQMQVRPRVDKVEEAICLFND